MSDLTTIHPGSTTAAIPPATAPGPSPKVKGESWAWQNEAFSFSDILDVLNPLQHIPIVNRIYRSITGDEIGLAPKIAGGTLLGGVIGLVASVVDSIVEETTGKDASQRLIAALQSGHEDDDHMETGLGTEVASLATADDRCRPKWRGRGLRQSSPKHIARGGIRQSGGTERHLDQDDAKCQRDKTAWRFRSRQRHHCPGHGRVRCCGSRSATRRYCPRRQAINPPTSATHMEPSSKGKHRLSPACGL
ncbi:MAG: hypothetical protein ACI82H_001438 [Alphaproteobacteria bacterium]|jgi:hypothetical protein